MSSKTLPRNYNNSKTISKPTGHLEYFDLDHSNPPPICKNVTSASTSNLSNLNRNQRHHSGGHTTDSVHLFQKLKENAKIVSNSSSGVVYKSVDFVKTEAIKRTLEGKKEEMNRAKLDLEEKIDKAKQKD